jgi:hypothetical protein
VERLTIYIAGKVTGEPRLDCALKFEKAENEIKAQGFEVINPLKVVNNPVEPWQSAMRKCISAMLTADAVLMLPCYTESRGALLELKIANEVGIRVLIGSKDLNKRL